MVIDITPGKTIVKIDNRVLPASQYVMLDSSRTMTTVNLTIAALAFERFTHDHDPDDG